MNARIAYNHIENIGLLSLMGMMMRMLVRMSKQALGAICVHALSTI